MAYSQGIAAFSEFRSTFGFDSVWPAKHDHVVHFVAHLSLSGKAYSTVRTYLAGLSAKHRLNGWVDPTDSFLIKKLLQGLSKSSVRKDARYPITCQRLRQIVSCLHSVCTNSYETTLFRAAFTLAFFGFFRISELLGQEKKVAGGRPGLTISDIQLQHAKLLVHLAGSKTDQSRRGAQVVVDQVVKSPEICPLQAMSRYIQIRPRGPGPLFIHFNGARLSKYQFQAVLKKSAKHLGWDTAGFSTHSFRIGAATTAAMNGMPQEIIMQKGRWQSQAVKKYVRPNLA